MNLVICPPLEGGLSEFLLIKLILFDTMTSGKTQLGGEKYNK